MLCPFLYLHCAFCTQGSNASHSHLIVEQTLTSELIPFINESDFVTSLYFNTKFISGPKRSIILRLDVKLSNTMLMLVRMYQRVHFLKLCALECIHHIYKHWRDDYALITLRPTEGVVKGVGGLIPLPRKFFWKCYFCWIGWDMRGVCSCAYHLQNCGLGKNCVLVCHDYMTKLWTMLVFEWIIYILSVQSSLGKSEPMFSGDHLATLQLLFSLY